MKIIEEGQSLEDAAMQSGARLAAEHQQATATITSDASASARHPSSGGMHFGTASFAGAATQVDPNTISDMQKVAADRRVDMTDWPSKCAFYATQDIAFRALGFRELSMLHASQVSGSFRSMAEAMSMTVLNYPGMDLTFGDYQFLMYRHLTQMNRPFQHLWTCQGEQHVQWVTQGYREVPVSEKYPDGQMPIAAASLEQVKHVTKNDLTITHPDLEALGEIVDGDCKIAEGLYLFPTRVADSVALGEARDALVEKASQDEKITVVQLQDLIAEMEWISNYAMVLNPDRHGKTLEERVQFVEQWFASLEPEQHFDVLEKLDLFMSLSDHGVIETVNTKCEVCGHRQSEKIAFDPTDFFPRVPARRSAENQG